MIGTTISHYRVLQQLGSGGMGVVYRAEDVRLGREVALKFLPAGMAASPDALARFNREARLASSLSHPHICTIHAVGEHLGRPFIVMEFCNGRTVKQFLESGPIVPPSAISIVLQASDALRAAHERGIVHRDVKPANLLVSPDGQVKVLDFGLAKLVESHRGSLTASSADVTAAAHVDDELTRPGMTLGTVAYMSPEQALGRTLDARSDLFSLGSVFHEMLTGQRAFGGSTFALIYDGILNRDALPPSRVNPDVPPALDAIVQRLLTKRREDRYQRAADLIDDLRSVQRQLDAGPITDRTSGGRTVSRVAAPSHVVPAADPDAPTAETPKPLPFETAAPSPETPIARRSPRQRRAMAALAVIVALAAVAAVAGRRWPGTSATRISGQDMILLAGIENRTGEPVFQDTLSQALGVQLAQSPYLNLVPEDRVRETLRQMGRGPEERPTGEVARELCQRLRLKAMVEGSVSRLGRSYALLVQARACETGDSLAHAQGTASSKEEVLHALGTVSASLRQTLGESLKSVEQYNVPVAQATTPSLDALRAYTLGLAQRARGAELESIPFLERALTLDPNFAAAATTLSTVYGNLGEWRRAEEHARIAYANRDRVSERERLFITYQFHDRVTGDQVAAAETLSVWKATFPGDFRPSNLLAIVHNRLGRFDQGVAEAQEALHRSPKHPFPLSNLAYAYRGLGEFDKARKVAEQAVALGIATVPTRRLLYQLAVLQGDAKGAAQQREWARGNPREFDLVSAEAQVAAYHGRMVEARELYRTAMQMAIGRGLPEWAAAQAAHAAWTEALYGNADRALAWAREALRADEARETTALANPRLRALITFALLGARETPSLVAAAVSRYPDSTFTRGLLLPSVRGTEAIHRRDWNAALAELKAAEPYELGYSGVLIPVYLRALANLARGDGPVAAADFQKMIRHRGSDPFSPMVALAHLGLARAKRLAGDTGGSAAAFERFLELWKNADADLPVFLDAAREHRALVATRNSTE